MEIDTKTIDSDGFAHRRFNLLCPYTGYITGDVVRFDVSFIAGLSDYPDAAFCEKFGCPQQKKAKRGKFGYKRF